MAGIDENGDSGDEEVHIDNGHVRESTQENIYDIDGVTIRFPYAAYQCQQDMMKEIIKGVQQSQNCLLESPTGTGKTAAILCALLAWQQKYMKDSQSNYHQNNNNSDESSASSSAAPDEIPSTNPDPAPEKDQEMEIDEESEKEKESQVNGEFSQPFPATCTTTTQIVEKEPEPEETREEEEKPKLKPPKIYYATRTHTQIKSVVTQLKKTAYAHVPMTILGSREQFCVNPLARKKAEESTSSTSRSTSGSASDIINKFCEDHRMAGAKKNSENLSTGSFYKSTCSFYLEDSQADFSDFAEVKGAVDIEDLVQYGKEFEKCPYYGSRQLLTEARIIFCTYNHLLQRSVRAASKVQFENSIFIFDEAHNIESFCTDQASSEFSLDKVDQVKGILAEARGQTDIPLLKVEPLRTLDVAFTFLSKWLRDQSNEAEAGKFKHFGEERKYDAEYGDFVTCTVLHRDLNEANFANFDLSSNNPNPNSNPNLNPGPSPNKRYRTTATTQVSFPDMMNGALFGPDQLPGLWASYFFMEDQHRESKPRSNDTLFKLDRKAANFIGSLLSTLQYLFKREKNENGEFLNPDFFPRLRDYKIDLFKTVPPRRSSQGTPQRASMKLVMSCQNPGLVFEKMKECRTVIVTSGTLSPIESFASELDIPFERTLVANHVLSRDRYFVNIIDKLKPNSTRLELTYKNYNGETTGGPIRDDLGEIVLSICKTVPNGILVFVPSKAFLRIIKAHFIETEILEQIEEVKSGGVFWETDLQEQNKRMPEMIAEYLVGAKDRKKGAVLFAFCRGRVSEGVDFTDEQARAVITMGIPYLPTQSEKVIAKMKYNDRRFLNTSNEFTGPNWYNCSAYRALNQAFGRCIRHSNDWGVICIIDQRLRYTHGSLSRWVRDGITQNRIGSLEGILPRIQQFVQRLSPPQEEDNDQ